MHSNKKTKNKNKKKKTTTTKTKQKQKQNKKQKKLKRSLIMIMSFHVNKWKHIFLFLFSDNLSISFQALFGSRNVFRKHRIETLPNLDPEKNTKVKRIQYFNLSSQQKANKKNVGENNWVHAARF